MATRLPYYSGQDDIYSRLMAQFAQQTPYYSASPYYSAMPADTGLLGGYDTSLFSQPAASSATTTTAGYRTPAAYDSSMSPGAPGDGNTAWGNLTAEEQAAFYAEHPTMAAITQGLQGLFGLTTLGQIQNALVPGFVQDQQEIAQGIVPGSVNSISAQNGMDVGAHPGLGFGSGLITQQATTPSQSLTGGLLSSLIGTQAGAPVTNLDTLSQQVAAQQQAAEINASLQAAAANEAAAIAAANADAISSNAEAVAGMEAALAGPATGGDTGGGGDGGGSKMICTKLHYLGKMPEDIFVADQAFGALMAKSEPETYAGYAIWARHVVRWMSREDWIGKTVVAIVHKIATPWSVAMAEEMGVDVKSGWFGRFLMKRGLQMCRVIGKMNQNRSLQNV